MAVSINRVGLKPPDNPRHPEYNHKGMIHWDTDITQYPTVAAALGGVPPGVTGCAARQRHGGGGQERAP